jgi:signal transduction histidine kinase
MARRTLLITYLATYLLAISSIIRILVRFGEDRFWSITLLAGGYLVLLFSEPFLIRRNRHSTYIYLFVQSAIICTLAFITPNVDFWAMLFCPLVVQVMHNFPQRTGFLITGIFTVITSILLLLGLGLEVGLPLIFVYGVIYFLLAAFIAIIRESEAAREESQKQQTELQFAHRQLQTYTAQAEELAVLQERNRLARDVHDSVTQSIYSLTLLAEAGQRMIKSGDLQQVEGNQSRLGEIAQQALQEMRLLVYELRPQVLGSVGLMGALEQRLEAVERRAGIDARMLVDVEIEIPADLEVEVYHIAQEALNNALKHTKASEVVLSLRATEDNLTLEVEDNGQGYDPELARTKAGIGLTSIAERVDNIGGKLTIQSEQDVGTTVRVTHTDHR